MCHEEHICMDCKWWGCHGLYCTELKNHGMFVCGHPQMGGAFTGPYFSCAFKESAFFDWGAGRPPLTPAGTVLAQKTPPLLPGRDKEVPDEWRGQIVRIGPEAGRARRIRILEARARQLQTELDSNQRAVAMEQGKIRKDVEEIKRAGEGPESAK